MAFSFSNPSFAVLRVVVRCSCVAVEHCPSVCVSPFSRCCLLPVSCCMPASRIVVALVFVLFAYVGCRMSFAVISCVNIFCVFFLCVQSIATRAALLWTILPPMAPTTCTSAHPSRACCCPITSTRNTHPTKRFDLNSLDIVFGCCCCLVVRLS